MVRFLMARVAIVATAVTFGAIPALAADPTAGGDYFRTHCSVCHGNTANSPPGVGPRLFGVVGRRSGSLPGYSYSPAMRQSGLVWSPDLLLRYLTSPQSVVKGNKMPFPGIPGGVDRENVVAYLTSLH
jgi:cytochrome c2